MAEASSPILPLPPVEMRMLVGPTEESFFDNPSGRIVFPELAPEQYDSVLDFGCGCGRISPQLLPQQPRPRRYVGVDLHRGMIEWDRRNLAPHDPGFSFHHLDVANPSFNPAGASLTVPFPVADRQISLMLAWSVFTHTREAQTEFYLAEAARVLAPTGILISTWFLFDKSEFPMMQDFQNALFINDVDPTNAVIFDRAWLRALCDRLGLAMFRIVAPLIRGYQWQIWMTPRRAGVESLPYPEDAAPLGRKPPPLIPPPSSR